MSDVNEWLVQRHEKAIAKWRKWADDKCVETENLRQAVIGLKALCHVVARGHTREDRIHKALEANRIAASVGCMNGVIATQVAAMEKSDERSRVSAVQPPI